jgi:hypothetical protein
MLTAFVALTEEEDATTSLTRQQLPHALARRRASRYTALAIFDLLAGTLAATRLSNTPGKLFAWVHGHQVSSSACHLLSKAAQSRSSSTLGSPSAALDTLNHPSSPSPFPCCALYGNPSLIDPDYSLRNPSTSSRFDWRARVKRHSIEDLNSTYRNKRRYPRRVRPEAAHFRPGVPFYNEAWTYQQQCVFLSYQCCWVVMPSYHSFIPMLEAEREEDDAVIKERLSSWSLKKLQDEGYCITDLSASWLKEQRYGKPVAAFCLGHGIVLPPHHRFECVRDIVCIDHNVDDY